MSSSREFVDFVSEILQGLGEFSTKRMFGCVAFIQNERMFALVNADDRLYVKVDELTRPTFDEAGCCPFTYFAKHRNTMREVALSYYTVPDTALDSPDELLGWVHLGIDAAIRSSTVIRGGKSRLRKRSRENSTTQS